MAGTGTKEWIGEVDGLRALACAAVIYEHYNPWLEVSDSNLYNAWSASKVVAPGSLGVIFFFCLSSFLLTYLGTREFESTGHFSVKRFIARRCLRIWPLYFTVVFAYVIFGLFVKPHFPHPYEVQAGGDRAWLRQLWLYVAFLQNWIKPDFGEMGILWSLAVEEQFYIFFPFIFLLTASTKTWGYAFSAMIIAALGFRIFVVTAPSNLDLYYVTPSYLDVFACGAAAGWLAARKRIPAIYKSRILGPMLALGIFALGYLGHDSFFAPYSARTVIVFSGLAVIFSSTILWVVSNPDSMAAKALRNRLVRRFGVLSFGIYMWHVIAHRLVAWAWGMSYKGDLFFVTSFLAYASLAVVFASLSFALVERPFLRLKRRAGGNFDREAADNFPSRYGLLAGLSSFFAFLAWQIAHA